MALKIPKPSNIRKSNVMIEYSVLAVIVLAAFLGIQIYLKRAISGRWRDSADSIGRGRQYQYEELTDLNP